MKNMPSVIKEMPVAADRPVAGKRAQRERLLSVVDSEKDFSASAAKSDSPETFQRLLQKNLQDRRQASVPESSPGGDRQIEDHDIGRVQMTQRGIKSELQTPVGEEFPSDREEVMATPEIRGTAKKKISKGQFPVGATHFIISSGNIAPVHEYRDPSLKTTVGNGERPDSPRDTGGAPKFAAAGVASPSSLKAPLEKGARKMATTEEVSTPSTARGAKGANVAPIELRSDAAEILPSHGGERGAHGKVEEPIRLNIGRVDGRAAFAEKATGIGRSLVTAGTGGSDNSAPPDALGKSMRTVRSANSPRDNGVRGDAAGAVHTPLKQNPEERAQGLANRSKAFAPPSAPGGQGTDTPSVASGSAAREEILSLGVPEAVSGTAGEPHRFGARHVDGRTVFTETGSVSGGHAATVETDGSGSTDSAGARGAATHVTDGGTESGQDDGGKRATAAVSASPFKTSPGGGPVPPPITGKKVSQRSNAFSAQAPNAVPPEAGSDAAGMPPTRGEHQNAPGETEGAVQFLPRQVRKEAASAERGAGPGGRAAVEKGGSDSAASLGIRGEPSRPGGGEPRQDSGSKATASGIAPSPFGTGAVERIHQPLTGEKVTPLPSAFTAAVAGTAQIAPGGDTGEGISSAGRQTVLLTQIIEAAQPLMQQGGGRILISLNPPSLGALDIDVRVKNDSVELFVIANNRDVQQTLCTHVEQLRKALVDQGLNMDRFQVVVGDHSGGQQGGDPRQEGMSGWQRESHNDRDGYRPEGDEENAGDGMRKEVRTDVYPSVGGINVFI